MNEFTGARELNLRRGEVFPDWVPVLRGRTLAVGLAVVPASFVSAIVTSGGLGMIKAGFGDGLFALGPDTWAAIGPALLWPLWAWLWPLGPSRTTCAVAVSARTAACEHRRHACCLLCGSCRHR